MLSTIDFNGQIHARPMRVQGELDCSGTQPALWFFTYGSSLKVSEMQSHGQQVNLSFNDGDKHYLSVSGVGSIVRDRVEIERRWKPILKEWFPKGLDEPDIALLKIYINKAEYWEVPSVLSHAITFMKTQMSGKPADTTGTHEKLTMTGKTEQKEQTRSEEAKMADVK